MNGADARVQGLVDEGRITVAEGERLRRALRGHSRWWTFVRNPVEYLPTRWAWMLAVLVVAASVAASQLGVRFDGAIDVHRVNGSPAWRTAVIDQIVAVVFTASVFWLASLATWRRGRWQDFALATAIARVPALLLCLWSLAVVPDVPRPEEILRIAQSGQVPTRLLISNIGSFPLLAWMIFWLYRGFAFSAGAQGPVAGLTFVLALVAAEVSSKPLLVWMIRGGAW
jgi:hypothetical protein